MLHIIHTKTEQFLPNKLFCGIRSSHMIIQCLVYSFSTQLSTFVLLYNLLKNYHFQLYKEFTSTDISKGFKKMVVKRSDVDRMGGISEASVMGTTHSIRHEEEAAFVNWINV